MKNSISYQALYIASRYYTGHFKKFYVKVRKYIFIKVPYNKILYIENLMRLFKRLDFNATSIQTQSKSVTDLKLY